MKSYLFDSGDVLLHHARVQALDLEQSFTHTIGAKRAKGPREDCSIRALYTHTGSYLPIPNITV